MRRGTNSAEYSSLMQEIEVLGKKLREERENEYARLVREFRTNKYATRYNVEKKAMLAALFGYDFIKRKFSGNLDTYASTPVKLSLSYP